MINKENLLSNRAGISYLQITILIIAVFAFAYLIYESEKTGVKEAKEKVKTEKANLILTILSSIKAVLAKPMLPEVSALENYVCCEKLKSNGAWCQYTNISDCDSAFRSSPSLCESTSFCNRGCCINPEGYCQAGVAENQCLLSEGLWEDNNECNIQECSKGCCVLGDRVRASVTKSQCEFYSADAGLEPEWYSGENELECLKRAITQEKGACVTGNNCRILTNFECLNLGGTFAADLLCTNPILNTTCQASKETTCVEGKDEVYFLDTCGNVANIYDAKRVDDTLYWKKIISKQESCGAGNNNINSKTCGNCEYEKGSICKLGENKPSYGDYICADLNCYNTPDNNGKTKDRKNGESWCVYDGAIGEGKDLVGSRHFRYVCVQGEVKLEPCADFRNEICTQKDIEEQGTKISKSECRINNWQECLEANTDDAAECSNKDCFTRKVDVDKGFSFDTCLPEYSPGFNLKEESRSAKEICSLASQKCTVIYQKKLFSGWKCVQNCDCEKSEFTQKMNDFCTGLGDCGFKMNIVGNATENYRVTGAPKAAKVVGDLIWQGNYPYPGNPEDFVDNGTIFNNLAAALSAMNAVENIASGMFGLSDYATNLGLITSAVVVAIDTVGQLIIIHFFPWASFCPMCLGIDIIVIFILIMFLGIGKTKEKIVEFKCMPWQPPIGGNNCNKCDKDGKVCSKYRCESLGSACKFMNEGTTNEFCEKNVNDMKAPIIKPWNEALLVGYRYENIAGGIKVKGESECVQAFTPIQFGIMTTNSDGAGKASQCKYDVDPKKSYDEMELYFGDDNLFLYNHSMQLNLPSVDYIAEQFVNEENNITRKFIEEKYGNLKFNIKCQDDWGNMNSVPYLIQICVSPGPDIMPPIINKFEPVSNSYVPYNVSSKQVTIYTNEPASCRWAEQASTKYEDMKNSFSCLINLEEQTIFGWPCSASLENLTKGDNTFYIRCKDKPWLDENNNTRYSNQEDYEYVLKVSEEKLKINSLEPNKTIIGGSEPFSVKLETYTSGGAENGKARCSWEMGSFRDNFFPLEYSTSHNYQVSLSRGSYNLNAKCEDIAGNTADASTTFKLELDTNTPSIVRVYNKGGSLYIYTDEDSTCSYSFKNCRFRFENGTLMSGGYGKEHSADWSSNTYYIKCKDAWGNEPGGCSIKVRPENV